MNEVGSRGLLVFVDDDKWNMEPYVEALSKYGWDVKYFSGVDSALEFIRNEGSSMRLLIWDMMMPPGKSFDNQEHSHGLATGRLFFEAVRKLFPRVPAILLTILRDEVVLDKYRKMPHCTALRKQDILPSGLTEFAEQFFLSNGSSPALLPTE